jgi:poly(hydroxyalkanoate) depolymerase family esterase
MHVDFSSAMRAIAELTRAQKLMEATRLIQTALSGKQEHKEAQDAHIEKASTESSTRPRKPLAEVIETLRRAKRDWETPVFRAKKTLKIPTGTEFLAGSFTCAAGTRDYRLYIPSGSALGPRPLLVMLHGCKQDPVDFAIGTRMNSVAEGRGMFVLYPWQPQGANPMSCWNWFNPKDQTRDAGEPLIIAGMTHHIISRYNIDPDRVFVAGLSAGGAMAAVMGATYPDIYAGIGIHSGVPYKAANDVRSAFAAMRGEPNVIRMPADAPRIRTIVFHGDGDQTVHPSNAAKIIAAQSDRNDIVERIGSTGNQPYTRTITRDHNGKVWNEHWLVHGGRHAWSGGSFEGSFTDPQGPEASREMVRFFLEGVIEP